MVPQSVGEKMKEHFLFAFQFDNHIFCDLSPFSLTGMENECMYDKFTRANWNLHPKTLLKIKAHFIDFIRLHSVQHVTIISIKYFHLLIMVFGFFQEVHQSLSVLSSRDDLLIECFRLFKHIMGLVDCLVNLLNQCWMQSYLARHYAFQASLSLSTSSRTLSYCMLWQTFSSRSLMMQFLCSTSDYSIA